MVSGAAVFILTPDVWTLALAAGIVLYVLSRLVADAAGGHGGRFCGTKGRGGGGDTASRRGKRP